MYHFKISFHDHSNLYTKFMKNGNCMKSLYLQ